MTQSLRTKLATWCFLGVFTVSLTGCCGQMIPRTSLRQSQFRANQLYGQNKGMAQESEQYKRLMGQLQQQNDQLRGNLDIANKRIDNLNAERSQLAKLASQKSPLSSDATARLEEWARKFPNVSFDPTTGVAKLESDMLFDPGSDEVRPQAEAALREVAKILNEGATRQLRVQVVGHTDDRPIVKASTKAKHPTNWHLSTDRANSVLLSLKKHGLDERRMRSSGAGMFENVADNKDPKARAKNRRVEIYVLAPDAKDVAAVRDTNRE